MKTALLIFEIVGSVSVWPFLFGYLQYRVSVKGSHRRYIARSILRPTLYIVPVYFAVRVIETYLEHNWLLLVCDLYNTYWTTKKLKRWAKRTARSLVPKVYVPVPVGAR